MRSDSVKSGMQNVPKRALLRALGLTEEEMTRPLVGVVNSFNEVVPGHMNLDKITEAVKAGVDVYKRQPFTLADSKTKSLLCAGQRAGIDGDAHS